MKTLILTSLLALHAPPAPAGGDGCDSSRKDIVSTALAAGEFKTLAAALGSAGLVEALQGPGPFTVFAPTDAAFARLPEGTVESLLKPENRQQLVDLLTYHVVPADLPAKAVVERPGLESLLGQRLTVHVEEGAVSVAGARVTRTDIACTNGVIHVVDSVLMPVRANLVEVAAGAGTFKTLLAAAQAAGLAETLAKEGPFTVLAPTDEAFARLPHGTVESLLKPENKGQLAAILKAHVVSGRAFSDLVGGLEKVHTIGGAELAVDVHEGLRIGGARVLSADIQASNGVVHVIDTVIVPQ
jgi:transforming growth factor-beta-induced protein